MYINTSVFIVTLTYKGFSQMYRCGLWQLSSFQLPLGWNSRQFSSPAELLVKKWLCDISGDTTDLSFIHFHSPSIPRSFAPIQKSAEDIYKLMWSHARSTNVWGSIRTSGEFKRAPLRLHHQLSDIACLCVTSDSI